MSKLKKQTLAVFNNKNIRLIVVLIFFLLIVELYNWTQSGLFRWLVIIVFSLELTLIIFAFSKDSIKKIVGEYKHSKRSRLRWSISWYLLLFLLAPFSIYLVHELSQQNVPAAQLSILAIAPTLGGLVLAAASNTRITNKTHSELIHVARKLISATLLFVFFVPFIFIVDQLGGIDINAVPNFSDLQAWLRWLYFWLAAPCFYVGVFLFILGLIDLVFALRDFSTSKSRRQVKKKSKKTPLS